jgi:hypothetical protein
MGLSTGSLLNAPVAAALRERWPGRRGKYSSLARKLNIMQVIAAKTGKKL